MKKTILTLCSCIFLSLAVFGQTVNEIPIKDIEVEYIQIVGSSRFLSNKITVEIDFGQHSKFFGSGKRTEIRDEKGERVIFNSMIDALNFMSKNGYDFVQAYALSDENQSVYHYLMKKQEEEKPTPDH